MATYDLPPGYFLVRPIQRTGVLDFSKPDGELGNDPTPPPTPDPPVLVSNIPSLSPQEFIPFSYDTSQHFSSDVELTFSSAELPFNGLNINSAGLISGTPTGPGSVEFTVVAQDGYGGSVQDTASINIRRTPATGPASLPWNWPNFRTAANSNRIAGTYFLDTASATQKLFSYRTHYSFCQGILTWTLANRRSTAPQMRHIAERRLPGAIMTSHIDMGWVNLYDYGEVDFQAFPQQYARIAGNQDNSFHRDGSGNYLSRETTASASQRYMSNVFSQGMIDYCVAKSITNGLYDNTDAAAYMGDIIQTLFHDGMNAAAKHKHGTPQHSGSISGKGANWLDIPDWTNVPLGNPDTANPGFTLVNGTFFAFCHPSGWGDLEAGATIRSYRDDGATCRLIFKNNLPSDIATGWEFTIYPAGGNTYSGQWPGAPGFQADSTADQQSTANAAYWRGAAWRNFFDTIDGAIAAAETAAGRPARSYGYHHNAVSFAYLVKWNSGLDPNHIWLGKSQAVHCEHHELTTDDSVSFKASDSTGDYYYAIRNETQLKYWVGRHPFGLSHLNRAGPENDAGMPVVVGSVELSRAAHSQEGSTDARMTTFAGFYELATVMAGGGHWGPNLLHRPRYSKQFNTGLMILSFGGAPITPATAFNATPTEDNTADWLADPTDEYASRWGLHTSYDPAANSNKGVTTLRPSDWGGGDPGQWEMWWPGWTDDQGVRHVIVTGINMRPVGSSPINPWTPGAGFDAVKDTYTLHDIPAGKSAYQIDLETYVNSENDENVRNGIWASIDGQAPIVTWPSSKFSSVPGNPAGVGALIGGNGATLNVGPGDWFIYVIRDTL